jgi:hypothetical protein
MLMASAAAAAAFAASPASAQFFFKSPDMSGAPVTGEEPGIVGPALPGATPDELRAAMVWNIRAALNVAALQCQFEPTLLTLGNYNGMLKTHQAELNKSYDTLTNYFKRTNSTPKAGQTALDQFGTRVYSGYSTVTAQLTFCQVAGDIGQQIRFAPVGTVGDVARYRLRELRNSLVLGGEQQFPAYYSVSIPAMPPFGNDLCWKKGVYTPKRCEPKQGK